MWQLSQNTAKTNAGHSPARVSLFYKRGRSFSRSDCRYVHISGEECCIPAINPITRIKPMIAHNFGGLCFEMEILVLGGALFSEAVSSHITISVVFSCCLPIINSISIGCHNLSLLSELFNPKSKIENYLCTHSVLNNY